MDLDNMIYKFNKININDQNNDINNIYFNMLIDHIIKKKIYLKCNCNDISFFIPNEQCTCGIKHYIRPIPNEYLLKNILHYSITDFLFYKPYYLE